jgi:hypothetical protein
MSSIPPVITDLLKEAGLTAQESCWPLPQNNKVWIVKHKALEKLAAMKNIQYTDCKVELADSTNNVYAVSVIGHLGDRSEWSIGEASAGNVKGKGAYYFAMAEKRAKDRVILKLLGLHGDMYTDEDAEEFKDAEPTEDSKLLPHNNAARENWKSIAYMKKYMELEDWAAAAQAYDEISMEDRELLNIAPSKGGIWTTAERDALKAHGAVQQILTNELKTQAEKAA